MGVKIITDSTCDLSAKLRGELDITALPLTIFIDGVEYIDGVTITPEEFFEKLRTAKALPTTSQVTVGAFLDTFEAALAAGDEVVGIFLAEEMSGTIQSARIAKDTIGTDKIHIVDSRSVTFGLGALVLEAAKLRDTGLCAAELAEKLLTLRGKVKLLAVIDDLTYLQKGGRLSGASAFIGGMLGIKPIIEVRDGKVQPVGKARGSAKAYAWISDKMKEIGVDESYGLVFGHTQSRDQLRIFMDFIKGTIAIPCREILDIGVTVGTHAGPGCVGVAFYSK